MVWTDPLLRFINTSDAYIVFGRWTTTDYGEGANPPP